MSDRWNEPLPLMPQAMCDRMITKTDEYLSAINWRNNCTVSTLKEAVQMAKIGNDAGAEMTRSLRPTTRIFEDWINYNNLVTYLYNRDTNVRTLLSAYRNAIKCTFCTVLFVIYHKSCRQTGR